MTLNLTHEMRVLGLGSIRGAMGLFGSNQRSMSALAIWHSSRLNNCLTRVTKEKKASDKGIRQNL
jgi:hypothetical protein